MLNLKRVFLLTIFVFVIAVGRCYAIDESQFNVNNTQTNPMQNTSEASNVPAATNDIGNEQASAEENSNQVAQQENSAEPTVSEQAESLPENESATVSSITPAQQSGNSTVANILNIALIVIGVLLIFLAIAILLRLH